MQPYERFDTLEAANRTELYQLCRRAGLTVHPTASRLDMLAYLYGEKKPPRVEHPVNLWRTGLIDLIQDYWVMVEAQLSCPAKELGPPAGLNEPPKPDPSNHRAPKACYTCEDARVFFCVIDNTQHENLIKLKRKPYEVQPSEDEDMSGTAVLTPQTAPRAAAELAKLQRFARKRLAQELGMLGDDNAKVAFIDADETVQSQHLEMALKEWDAKQGGATPTAAATPVATPAAQATPVQEATVVRTPRTNGVSSQGASTPAASGAIAEALLKLINDRFDGLEKRLNQFEMTLASRDDTNQKATVSALGGLTSLTQIALGASIAVAEGTLNMPPIAVVAEATDHAQNLERYGAEAAKAGKG